MNDSLEEIFRTNLRFYRQRAKLSQPVIDKMRVMGILNDMPETSQLSLF